MSKPICIVTRAAHGIGEAIANTLRTSGWEVAALDLKTGCDVGQEFLPAQI